MQTNPETIYKYICKIRLVFLFCFLDHSEPKRFVNNQLTFSTVITISIHNETDICMSLLDEKSGMKERKWSRQIMNKNLIQKYIHIRSVLNTMYTNVFW